MTTTNESIPATTTKDQVCREPARTICRPVTDIIESEKDVVVRLNVPGISQESLTVKVEKDALEVTGQASWPDRSAYQELAQEHAPRAYHREFRLSDEMDAEQIKATLKNGVLTLRMAKKERAQPRVIPVT